MNILLFAFLFTYVNAPILDMREEPSMSSKMDSQAIYAEPVTILQEQGPWVKIQTTDSYTAWAEKTKLLQLNYPLNYTQTAQVNRCAAHVYGLKDVKWGPVLTLPFESKLEIVESDDLWFQVRLVDGTLAYIQRGDVTINPELISMKEVIELCPFFLDLPYTWGGRSSFGYDCSGFVQMLYRLMGIILPRNSRDQAVWEGFVEVEIDLLEPGDLIFFGASKDRISHVGMYLGNSQFIQAVQEKRPYLRISSLNEAAWKVTGLFPFQTGRTLRYDNQGT